MMSHSWFWSGLISANWTEPFHCVGNLFLSFGTMSHRMPSESVLCLLVSETRIFLCILFLHLCILWMQHENQSLQALAYHLDLNILVQIWSRLSQKKTHLPEVKNSYLHNLLACQHIAEKHKKWNVARLKVPDVTFYMGASKGAQTDLKLTC